MLITHLVYRITSIIHLLRADDKLNEDAYLGNVCYLHQGVLKYVIADTLGHVIFSIYFYFSNIEPVITHQNCHHSLLTITE